MKKSNAWNIRRLVDESFVLSTHGPRVLYLRLSDLRKEEEFIYKSSQKRHKAFCSVVIYLHYKLAYTRRHFFQNKIRSIQSCRYYALFTLKKRCLVQPSALQIFTTLCQLNSFSFSTSVCCYVLFVVSKAITFTEWFK